MLSDLRLTLRALAKSPGFAFVAVFTLTLGLGVNTAIFSIVNAVVLRGLPFPEASRLLLVRMTNPAEGINRMAVSQQDFADFRAQQKSFEDLAAYQDRTCTISGPGGDPERVTFKEVSFPQMEDALRQQRVDAAFMVPPGWILMARTAGSKPLASGEGG